jgi:hypothetical protein
MAYDKVVDSTVLDAGLKQIADAIREKGGTSDNLAFPQAMADAIAAIEAGGGTELPIKIAVKTIVYSKKGSTPVEFNLAEHGMTNPNFAGFIANVDIDSSVLTDGIYCALQYGKYSTVCDYYSNKYTPKYWTTGLPFDNSNAHAKQNVAYTSNGICYVWPKVSTYDSYAQAGIEYIVILAEV